MKVCFFIYNMSAAGGSERVTSIIANELHKCGHDVSILSICGNEKIFYSLDKNINVQVLYPGVEDINSKLKIMEIIRKSYTYHKKNKTAVIIDVFASRSLVSIPIKYLLKIKNITWEHFNYTVKEGLNPLGRKLSCYFSNAIITLTYEDTLLYQQDNRVRGLIDYIYNPTPYVTNKKNSLKNKQIITVGRLTYQKGYDMLLDIWSQVEKVCDWKLIIVGDGEDREALISKSRKLCLENIEFTGKISHVDELYLKSSIYVSTSRFEGLPMCMIEAQSFGLPIVSFECKTGPSEIVKNNRSGFLIEQGDINSFSDKLLELINSPDLLFSFSNQAKQDSERFDISSIISKWNQILQQL